MGIDYSGFDIIFRSLQYIKNKQNLLTLGRQSINLPNDIINDFVMIHNLSQLKNNYEWGYCEQFFMDLGFENVDSLDASFYEGASIIHNMNQPIPKDFKKYDYIYDGGTIEHIFNAPQVCENIINLLNVGGVYVSITPNNNLSGHGIYQFSPEFYLSAFSKKYGMEVKSLYLGKTGSGFSSWVDVNHLDGRNTTKFDGNCHVHNIAIITKISNERLSLITHSPNQYSYEEVDWK